MWNRKLKQASRSSRGSCTREMKDSCADFISQLPDHLLLHIFSFLDETAVFQSSVLSRRWRYLWTLVPFPTTIKQMRSYFKEEKASIRKEKLSEEEEAENTISELPVAVAKAILLYFANGLQFITEEFNIFVVIHFLITLMAMLFLFSCWSSSDFRLCDNERRLKRLQESDSSLTWNANYQSTCKISMMEPVFPENYETRYAKLGKLYALMGMLMLIFISCSLITLKWKFEWDFIDRRCGLILSCLSLFVYVGIALKWKFEWDSIDKKCVLILSCLSFVCLCGIWCCLFLEEIGKQRSREQ